MILEIDKMGFDIAPSKKHPGLISVKFLVTRKMVGNKRFREMQDQLKLKRKCENKTK